MGFWFNEYKPDNLPAGWFTDMTGMTPANISLKPGPAVFFNAKATGAKAVIPSALNEMLKGDTAKAYDFFLKANAQLQSMGIYPLPLPDSLRSYQNTLNFDE